jgi:hypothetical protein
MENAEAQSRRERRGMEKYPLHHRLTQQVNIFGAAMTPELAVLCALASLR